MSDGSDHQDLSVLLRAASEGDARAAEAIIPLVYDELRAMARAKLRRARPGATIEATALVHDAYVRLLGKDMQFANRRHFFFAAGRAMHDVLCERARRADQRAGAEQGAQESAAATEDPVKRSTILAMEEALPRLQAVDARAHDVVMLRFFAGLTFEQIAETLDVTPRTIERDWRFARTWLYDALRSEHGLSGVATLVASDNDSEAG
ncbi:MAG: sigma-70 family RNA polymerase sigma factor [Phycisphaerae bacterium]|nr:sigma-70 family RNA polymerase sigma factor [Phycisphaerae bacterium]